MANKNAPAKGTSLHIRTVDSVLLPQHKALLEASAISSAVIAARGYRSVDTPVELGDLGFNYSQWRTPCLVVPIHTVDKKIGLYQIRPDSPRISKGKAVKYDTPKGAAMCIDVPPMVHEHIGNPKVPLYITEGVKKADAAVSQGLCCVAQLGVWNFRGKNKHGGKTVLADWESIALNDRTVYLVFDSDAATNPMVQAALVRLRDFLESRGARVTVIALPSKDTGEKMGLDDYFAAGHKTTDLVALPALPLTTPDSAGSVVTSTAIPYRATNHGLVLEREVKGEVHEVPLTNFTAKITSELIITDGIDEHREFVIDATFAGRTERVSVKADEFDRMGWVSTRLGAEAVVFAGIATRDHSRAAIQLLSDDIEKTRAYGHTGWIQHEGNWLYLHAGGAIGADLGGRTTPTSTDRPDTNVNPDKALSGTGPKGPILAADKGASKNGDAQITVHLPGSLSNYHFPDPPKQIALVRAIHASLQMIELGPDHVMLPLYAAIWRAVLGIAEYSVFLVGETGNGKSTVAALAQQHFGKSMNAEHLPGSWSSTANALEATAFLVKDALFVVDDWVPRGSLSEVQRANKDADRLLRAQGNHSGRSRCNREGTPKEGKRPRGLIINTGEATPEGHSLNARFLAIEIDKKDIMIEDKLPGVSACQDNARDGLYAQAMAGFIHWLAPKYDHITEQLRQRRDELRQDFRCKHPRTATIVSDLIAGFEFFLEFAQVKSALTEDESDKLWYRLHSALIAQVAEQDRQLATQTPVQQFIQYLRDALFSGKGHLADTSGDVPLDSPQSWGWEEKKAWFKKDTLPNTDPDKAAEKDRKDETNSGTFQPGQDDDDDQCEERSAWWGKGDRIGWISGSDLYLNIRLALAVVQRLARDCGDFVPLTSHTLGKLLHSESLLASREEHRGKYTTRRNIQGKRHDVLHLKASTIINNEWNTASCFEPGHEFPFDGLIA